MYVNTRKPSLLIFECSYPVVSCFAPRGETSLICAYFWSPRTLIFHCQIWNVWCFHLPNVPVRETTIFDVSRQVMLMGLRALLGSLFEIIQTLKQLVDPRVLNQYRTMKYLNYLTPFETPAAVKMLNTNSLPTHWRSEASLPQTPVTYIAAIKN